MNESKTEIYQKTIDVLFFMAIVLSGIASSILVFYGIYEYGIGGLFEYVWCGSKGCG